MITERDIIMLTERTEWTHRAGLRAPVIESCVVGSIALSWMNAAARTHAWCRRRNPSICSMVTCYTSVNHCWCWCCCRPDLNVTQCSSRLIDTDRRNSVNLLLRSRFTGDLLWGYDITTGFFRLYVKQSKVTPVDICTSL